MDEILDDHNLEKPKGRIGEFSVYFFLVTIGSILFSFMVNPEEDIYGVHTATFMERASFIAILVSIISCLIGFILAIISLINKEETKIKIIGLVGNGLFFLFYLSIFSYILMK